MRVVLLCGDCEEPWNPRTLGDRGLIGGSEIAAAGLARRLSEVGHSVSVLTNPGEPGVYDGVAYLPTETIDEELIACEAAIVWRNAYLAEKENLFAKKIIYWAHDLGMLNPTPRALARIDAYVCQSRWHASFFEETYGELVQDKVRTIAGAIDTWIPEGVQRQRGKAIYLSSPARSLVRVLAFWPEIVRRFGSGIPELHVYYDALGTYRKRAEESGDKGGALYKEIDRLRERCDREHARVVFHSRLSPQALRREIASAQCWLYPTDFPEVFCAAEKEAMLAGIWRVKSSVAALGEDQNFGALVCRNEEDFVSAAVEALQARVPGPVRPFPYSWEKVLPEWLALLGSGA